ncbi:MAG: hypothetical protein QM765_53230 [Myxococcales bacterium]
MENPRDIDPLLQRLWILWGPLVAAPWLIVGVSFVASVENPELAQLRLVLFGVACAVAVGSLGASLVLAPRLREQAFARGTAPSQAIFTSFVVANALCEAGGTTAAVFFLMTKWMPLLGVVALGSLGCLLHRPDRDSLVEWFQQARRDAPRPAQPGGSV